MKSLILAIWWIAFPILLPAQGENNIWMMGYRAKLDFNSSPPLSGDITDGTTAYYQAGAACSPDGSLRFYVRLHGDKHKVFNAAGEGICNLTYDPTIYGAGGNADPIIVPMPGNANQYCIFYVYAEGILYTVIDMSLNDGAGGVVPGKHDVILAGFGTIIGMRTAPVLGCDGIWIVARSQLFNGFYSHRITYDGIDPVAVVSEVGTLDLTVPLATAGYSGGVLKGSPDGSLLVLTGHRGVELYDFEKCSGKVKNARIIDSLSATMLSDSVNDIWFYGACFSPDNSKLYITQNLNLLDSSDIAGGSGQGELFQYDVSLGSASAINLSKTLLIYNPITITFHIFFGCVIRTIAPLGEIKQGPDGRIYVGNNAPITCLADPPSIYNPGPGYHVVSSPNEPGLACNPILNEVVNISADWIGMGFPHDILTAPALPDTLDGVVVHHTACFKDSLVIAGSDDAVCYQWENGWKEKTRTVYSSGVYYFRYTDDACFFRTDTVIVDFVPLPVIGNIGYSCPSDRQGTAEVRNATEDGYSFTFEWKDASGNVLRTLTGSDGDVCGALDTGLNYLRIITESGCDTILSFVVPALPKPVASFDMDTVVCKEVSLAFSSTSAAPMSVWYNGWGHPFPAELSEITFPVAGDYDIFQVVTNIEGCTDTAYKFVQVKELNLSLQANPDIVHGGEQITLVSNAPESYSVLEWHPEDVFSNQAAYVQQVVADTSRTFTVIAVSDTFGCKDSARVSVLVEPAILMPNAFSPNGDGLNDLFAPVSLSGGTLLQSFLIFNRWGQRVYEAYDNGGLRGWDGISNGIPVNAGVYSYIIQLATITGKVKVLKGMVTLIR